jgi:plasmid stability protein
MDTTIRNIDPFVYKKLKTKAAQEGISIGEAVTMAVSEWLGLSKKKIRSIIDIKPEHFGKQYRNLSEEIDEVLYKQEKA